LQQTGTALPSDYLARLGAIRDSIRAELGEVQADLQTLSAALPARRRNLELLAGRGEVRSGTIYPDAYSTKELDRRAGMVSDAYGRTEGQIRRVLDSLEQAMTQASQVAAKPNTPDELVRAARQQLADVVWEISNLLLQLSVIQAGARLDAVSLTWVNLSPEEAYHIARDERPDWMNARTALVDSWRQIEVTANALMSNVSVTMSGDINTVDRNPLKFRSATGQLRAGLQFDAPLTRLVERNAYRTAQINYEQTRRQYYTFEDTVNQVLRAELRDIRVSQLDFELRRAAVLVAITQLDSAGLALRRPPGPGQTSQFGDTLARDLLQASSALLSAQNGFVLAWLNYEIQRMNLDFDLGTMRLDNNGMWIDPGIVEPGFGNSHPEGPGEAETGKGADAELTRRGEGRTQR
jgi:hypothetical protein